MTCTELCFYRDYREILFQNNVPLKLSHKNLVLNGMMSRTLQF